jgi:four helix bundle protein
MFKSVDSKNYDLEERTAKFAEDTILLAKSLSKNVINIPLINQLVKSATSIGANYMEANGASSKKDFKNKIYICKKEARETKYWLRIIAKANQTHGAKCSRWWNECQQLTLKFSKIIFTKEAR